LFLRSWRGVHGVLEIKKTCSRQLDRDKRLRQAAGCPTCWGKARAYGWFMTTPPPNSEGQVPTSSSQNRYATNRTVQIAVALIVVILLIAFVPW